MDSLTAYELCDSFPIDRLPAWLDLPRLPVDVGAELSRPLLLAAAASLSGQLPHCHDVDDLAEAVADFCRCYSVCEWSESEWIDEALQIAAAFLIDCERKMAAAN